MNNETYEYIKSLNKATLIEIIEALSLGTGTEIMSGPDPSDGHPTVYAVHPEDGSFTLAHIMPESFEPSSPKPKIDMDPRNTHVIRIEGDLDGILDSLGELIFCKSYEVVSSPRLSVPKWGTQEARVVCNNLWKPADNGCGCKLDPPCVGCGEVLDSQGRSSQDECTSIPESHIVFAMTEGGFSRTTAVYWKEWLECYNCVDIEAEEFVQFISERERSVGRLMTHVIHSKWQPGGDG